MVDVNGVANSSGDHQPRELINMAPDENEAIVVEDEKAGVKFVPAAPARPRLNKGFSWVQFGIISAIVAILGVVIVALPSLSSVR